MFNFIFNNYYILHFKSFIFLPEIFLSICILLLILYNVFFIEKFNQSYTFIFLFYSIICISFTAVLVVLTDYSTFCYGIFSTNYKISFIQIIILLTSLFCLVLFSFVALLFLLISTRPYKYVPKSNKVSLLT